MNFRVVEGDYSLYDKANAFVKLYNNLNYTVESIKELLGLSESKYKKLRKYCFDEGLLTVSRKCGGINKYNKQVSCDKSNPRWYYWNVDEKKFYVERKGVYYATFDTVGECERFIGLMMCYDWDKSKVDLVKELILND